MPNLTPTSRSSSLLSKILLCVLLIACTAGWGTQNQISQNQILIILSSDSPQFKSAAESASKQLKAAGLSTRTRIIDELNPNDIPSLTSTVLAVGGKASKILAENIPPTTNLYYCMVPTPNLIGLNTRSNTAGISSDADPQHQIELIKLSSQSIRKIGALYRSSSTGSQARIQSMSDAMPSNTELISVDLDTFKTVSQGIEALLERDVDIVWTTPDPAVYNTSTVKALLMECLKQRVPIFGFSHSLVRAGSTLGIGIDPTTQGSRVAQMILQNQINTHLPPTLTLAINTIVADRIKFKFNNTILQRAEVVFESD